MRAGWKIQTWIVACICCVCFWKPFDVFATEEEMQAHIVETLQELEPKLIVESYEIVEGQLAKGETFTLQIKVRNTNAYADAYNVVTTYLIDSDNIRLVEEVANQKYDAVIPAGKTVSYQYKCEVLETFSMDTAIINFQFSYENKYGINYTNASMITPKIHKSCVLTVHSLSVADSVIVGAKALVNVRYSSSGTSSVKNPTMIIEGNIMGGKKEVALADLTGSEQRSLDYYVNFSESGQQTLQISFRYLDENGKEYTLDKQEFVVNVNHYQVTVTSDDKTSVNQLMNEENRLYFIIGVVSFGLAVVFILAILIIKCSMGKQEKRRK